MSARSGTILIVDDDANFRMSTAALLEADGHVVETAGNGPEAADRLKERSYDLMLVDLKMPGIDGASVDFGARRRGD
jgi:CheY-like chemotaxis protein